MSNETKYVMDINSKLEQIGLINDTEICKIEAIHLNNLILTSKTIKF